MSAPAYGYVRRLQGVGFEEAIERVTRALAAQGFGVLTTIDVQATLKKKIDADFRPYRILGACNPRLAFRGLSAEPHLGLLLPCNVVVQQEADAVAVSIQRPDAMFALVGRPDVAPLADEADRALRAVLDDLGGEAA